MSEMKMQHKKQDVEAKFLPNTNSNTDHQIPFAGKDEVHTGAVPLQSLLTGPDLSQTCLMIPDPLAAWKTPGLVSASFPLPFL